MVKFLQVEYSFWSGGKSNKGMVIVNIDKIVAIYVDNHVLAMQGESYSLTERGWDTLMNHIKADRQIEHYQN